MRPALEDSDIQQMTVDERLDLIERLWDSILHDDEEAAIGDDLRQELDRRWAAYKADPTNVLTWEEVRARLSVFR